MKRLIVLLAVVSLPFLAGCEPVVEPPAGSPACTNINGGDGFFDGNTVFFSATLDDNPCPDVRYRLFVNDEQGGPRVGSATYRGSNTSMRVDWAVAVTDADPNDQTVCVYAWTIAADGTKLDRAPDSGCSNITVGDPPAGRNFH